MDEFENFGSSRDLTNGSPWKDIISASHTQINQKLEAICLALSLAKTNNWQEFRHFKQKNGKAPQSSLSSGRITKSESKLFGENRLLQVSGYDSRILDDYDLPQAFAKDVMAVFSHKMWRSSRFREFYSVGLSTTLLFKSL